MLLCGALLVAWYVFAASATAQVAPGVWPRCIPDRDGQQIGVGGSMCECRHEPGGTMLRRPAGWRWSCDIMQMDGERPDDPVTLPNRPSALPPGFVYAPQTGGGAAAGMQSPQQTTGPMSLFDGGRRRWP